MNMKLLADRMNYELASMKSLLEQAREQSNKLIADGHMDDVESLRSKFNMMIGCCNRIEEYIGAK